MAWVDRRHCLTNTRFVTCLLGSFQSSHPHKQIPIQLTSVYWCENTFLIFLLLFYFASNKTCVGQTMPVVNSCHFYCKDKWQIRIWSRIRIWVNDGNFLKTVYCRPGLDQTFFKMNRTCPSHRHPRLSYQ